MRTISRSINRTVHWLAGKHGPVVALVAGVVLGLSAALPFEG